MEEDKGEEEDQAKTDGPGLPIESQSLVDLLGSNYMLHETLMKLAHIIRVWLLLPQQALFFYQQALEIPHPNQAQTFFFVGITLRAL